MGDGQELTRYHYNYKELYLIAQLITYKGLNVICILSHETQ